MKFEMTVIIRSAFECPKEHFDLFEEKDIVVLIRGVSRGGE